MVTRASFALEAFGEVTPWLSRCPNRLELKLSQDVCGRHQIASCRQGLVWSSETVADKPCFPLGYTPGNPCLPALSWQHLNNFCLGIMGALHLAGWFKNEHWLSNLLNIFSGQVSVFKEFVLL